MAYRNNIIKKYYTTVATFVTDLWAELSAMGWTLEDNQDASSYRVYSSTNPNGVKGFLKITFSSSTQISFDAFTFWNSTTHTGYGQAYQHTVYNYVSFSTSGTYAWIYGNDQYFNLMTLIGSTYYQLLLGHLIPDTNIPLTYLTAAASSGSSVTIAVNSTANFVAGKKYQIVDHIANGYRQWVTVSSITDATHMVIASLSNSYSSGARIGATPVLFGYWSYAGGNGLHICTLNVTGNGIVPSSGDGILSPMQLFSASAANPNFRSQLQNYMLQPLYWYSTSAGYQQISGYRDDNIFLTTGGSSEDIFTYTNGADQLDGGTSSGSNNSTTLNDTTKAWATNVFANKVVVITGGPGAGQINGIVSNTATQLTVLTSWVTIPDNTSTYRIADEAYRLTKNNVVSREGV